MSNTERSQPSFSIYAFKYWYAKQPDMTNNLLQPEAVDANDKKVESRLGVERLVLEIASANPGFQTKQVTELAKLFSVSGGIVKESQDDYLVIVSNNNEFKLPKKYIKVN